MRKGKNDLERDESMRTPAEQLIIDQAKWTEVDPPSDNEGDLPFPTHSGELDIFGRTLKVHRLNDGRCIIEAESFKEMMRTIGIQ